MTPETTAGREARTDGDASHGQESAGSENVEYWRRNLRAALESLDHDAKIGSDSDEEVLSVNPIEDLDRDGRAVLVSDLERRGFTVLSETRAEIMIVDAPDRRLDYPFAETDREGSA